MPSSRRRTPLHVGRLSTGYGVWTDIVSNGELFVAGGLTFEFRTGGSASGSNVTVSVASDQSADAAVTALVTAMNAQDDCQCMAMAHPLNDDYRSQILLVGKRFTNGDWPLSTTCANGYVSANSSNSGKPPSAPRVPLLLIDTYSVQVRDIGAMAGASGRSMVLAGIPTSSTPTLVSWLVRRLGDDDGGIVSHAAIAPLLVQVNSTNWILSVTDSASQFQAGDLISFVVAYFPLE